VIETGDANVWNYAITLAFPDLGGEGNQGGLIIGMQPRLTGASSGLAAELGDRRDTDVGLHLEGFYQYRLNDSITITPAIIWLTAPNHDTGNPDIVIGAIRTEFRF
jgi:carbohydrate-selective porin OprB